MLRTKDVLNCGSITVELRPEECREQPDSGGRLGEKLMVNALVVEDNITFRQSLREILREHFPCLVVGEATTGKDALQKVEAWRPNLIFMDIKLPGDNGLELTKKIRKNYPETVIIILTSYDLPEYRHAAKVFGANYYLCKTSSSEEILGLVEEILWQWENKPGEER